MATAPRRSLPIAMARQIAESEAKAVEEIMRAGRTLESVVEVARNGEVWSDSLFEKVDAVNQPKLACRSGCPWCCHQMVTATPPEVFAIVEYLRRTLPAAAFAEMKERINAAEEKTRGLSSKERWKPDLPCPLLEGRGCSVHEVRPLSCRGTSSFDAEACESALLDDEQRTRVLEENATPIPAYLPHIQVASAVARGQLQGLAQTGVTAYPLELIGALRIVLEREGALERWLSGKPVFAKAKFVAE